jgi:hypothetical protein
MTETATKKAQVKPLTAYAELGAAEKRLCNKLITALHRQELHADAIKAINAAINRAKRDQTPTGKGKYVNGWLLFYKEQHQKLRRLHPDMNVTGVAKRVSGNWKELSAVEKAKYAEKARKLRANA